MQSIAGTKAASALVLAQPPAVETVGILDEHIQNITFLKFELVFIVHVIVVECNS